MSRMLDESVLDSVDGLTVADQGGVLRETATAGAQLRHSVQLTSEAGIPDYLDGLRPRAVLVTGDPAAESAVQAVAAMAAGPAAPAPLLVHRGTDLPVWVGPVDLLLIAAHNGADSRLVGVAEAAVRRGVPMVVVGPSPAPLEEACGRARAPYVPMPGDRPARAALWGLLAPLLVAADRCGLAPVRDDDLAVAADLLDATSERCRPSSETFTNPGKSLALEIGATLPIVWGTSPLAGVAAFRFAGLLAGNAAHPALWGTLPLAAHHLGGVFDAAGASNVGDLFRDRVDDSLPQRPRLVLLRDAEEAVDVQHQVGEITEVLAGLGVPVTELVAEPGGPVTRLAAQTGLLDFVSVYVGLALGLDPSAVRTGQVAPP